jgi:hypothetical protein
VLDNSIIRMLLFDVAMTLAAHAKATYRIGLSQFGPSPSTLR